MKQSHPTHFLPTVSVILVSTLFLIGSAAAGERAALDWERVGALKPKLKVLALVTSRRPFTVSDMAVLADRGLVPADRDPGLIVGTRRAVFTTRIGKWQGHGALPDYLHGRLLSRFVMSGIYRVGFRVQQKGYAGPLRLEVTAPRGGFGRHLIVSEHVVRPRAAAEMQVDSTGNRWLCVEYPSIKTGQIIKFHFGFKYVVDMSELLERDLDLSGESENENLPADVATFLQPGYKIDPSIPQAVQWASRGKSGPPDARREYARLSGFLKQIVAYDKNKRAAYFGGRSVYSDVDEMYQDPRLTLARGAGCCPDTILLECAFLRARGIPCRTAGRFGHFLSQVYVSGRGWMSTSVTPTGIPLVVDPGPDHLPYQRWRPRIKLRTTVWEARVRIEPMDDAPRVRSKLGEGETGISIGKRGFPVLLKRGLLKVRSESIIKAESDGSSTSESRHSTQKRRQDPIFHRSGLSDSVSREREADNGVRKREE